MCQQFKSIDELCPEFSMESTQIKMNDFHDAIYFEVYIAMWDPTLIENNY